MDDQQTSIEISVWLTELQLSSEFIAAFQKRSLDEKFFYWFPLSVRAWLDLCSDGEYRNFMRSKSLIASTSSELARQIAGIAEVVSLGSGQGDKDLMILTALKAGGRTPAYVPVDASQGLLEMACAGAVEAGFDTAGVKADFADSKHLDRLLSRPGGPRLTMMLGNTLGCLDPPAALLALSGLLRPGDLLLVDAEIKAEETIAGYDNAINRRFAWAPLESVGISEADGDLEFEEKADPDRPGLHLVSKHFRATTQTEAILGGRTFKLQPGDIFEMSHSYKYSETTLDDLLKQAGLDVVWRAIGGDGRFLMILAGPGYPDRR